MSTAAGSIVIDSHLAEINRTDTGHSLDFQSNARWPTVQNWVQGIREARRNYGRRIVERLHELRNPRQIGIAGLGGGTRTPEGADRAGPGRRDSSGSSGRVRLGGMGGVNVRDAAWRIRTAGALQLGSPADVRYGR